MDYVCILLVNIYDDTQVLSKNKIFDYEKHIEKQKEIHKSLKALDGISMCIHKYRMLR